MRPMPKILCLLGLAAAMTPAARADRIELTNGRSMEGTVVRRTTDPQKGELVTIRTGQAELTMPAAQIASITQSTPAQQALLRADASLKTGNYDDGAKALAQALDAGGTVDGPDALIAEYGAILAEQSVRLTPESRQALIRVLTSIGQTPGAAEGRSFDARLALNLSLGEDAAAQVMIVGLSADYFAQHPARQQQLTQLLNARLDRQAQTGDYPGGLATLDLVKAIDPQLADGLRIQHLMRWGRALREAGQFEDALRVYLEQMKPVSPEIALEFVRQTLDEAEKTYQQGNQDARAIDLLTRYGLPNIPEEARGRLVRIWKALGWRALRNDEFDAAEKAFKQADATMPGTASVDLKRLEFRRREAAMTEGDLLGFYDLGVWCYENQINDRALEAFTKAAASEIVGDNARAYIERINNIQAELDLRRMFDLFDEGNFRDVLQEMNRFEQRGYAKGYQAQAIKIRDLTLEAMRLRMEERPQQAEAIFQQAQRAYLQGHYEEAQTRLKTIFEQYRDTITYPSARNFYAQVRDKLALAALEQGQTKPQTADSATTATTITTTLASPPEGISKEIDDLYRSLERIHQE